MRRHYNKRGRLLWRARSDRGHSLVALKGLCSSGASRPALLKSRSAGDRMKVHRRHVLAGLAGAVAPGGSVAQTASKVYRVGLLTPAAALTDTSPFGAPLVRGLTHHGYRQNHNLAFERRGAEGHMDRLPRLVADLVASKVDVIVAIGYPAALAVKQGTTMPAVISGAGDPVGTGLIDDLAHPGGHLTGISDVSAELSPKRLDFLKEVAPGLRRVAVLWNAADLGMTLRYDATQAAAQTLGVEIQPLGVREPDDFDEAFAAMERERPDGILMVSDALTTLNRQRVYDFAAEHHVPAIYEFDFLVRDGGLMAYGPDQDESFERVAALVDRILKGAKPADLPFEQPTRFRLTINLKTAKALGLTVPDWLLGRADEVIE